MSDFKIMNDPLYDDSYPMKLLEQAFEMQVEQAEKATNKLVSDILKSEYSKVAEPSNPTK